ncbi:MAG: hypothetical protein M1816_002371 [Peltula sp. TS41687]|nr:MAG: hypothetical protein M1816_002371 [Peltula sp. TS41687]
MVETRAKLPILKGDNYKVWSQTLKNHLIGEGLWYVVEPGETGQDHAKGKAKVGNESDDAYEEANEDVTLVASSSKTKGKEKAKEDKDDVLKDKPKDWAKATFFSTCDQVQVLHILDIELASEQWKKLKSINEGQSKQRLGTLLNQFYSFRAEGKGIDEAITSLNGLQADIKRIDPTEGPTESSKKVILLKGLDPEYDLLIKVLNSQEGLTFNDMVAKLKDEDATTVGKWAIAQLNATPTPRVAITDPSPGVEVPQGGEIGAAATSEVDPAKGEALTKGGADSKAKIALDQRMQIQIRMRIRMAIKQDWQSILITKTTTTAPQKTSSLDTSFTCLPWS